MSGPIASLGIELTADIARFTSDLSRAEREAKKSAEKLAAQFTQAGKAIGAGLLAGLTIVEEGVRRTIDNFDDLSKTAQKIGVSTEALSGLSYAAKLADVSTESLSTGLGKLVKFQVAAANGTLANARAFEALGIKTKDASGNLRGTTDVLGDVADLFQKLPDGPEKSALAMEVFGKAGRDLIPLLNGGAAGIKDLTAEAKLFGVTISTETGKAAEDFNDNLTRLHTAMDGVFAKVAKDLLPSLVTLSGIFVDNAKDAAGAAQGASTLTTVVESAAKAAIYLGEATQIVGAAWGLQINLGSVLITTLQDVTTVAVASALAISSAQLGQFDAAKGFFAQAAAAGSDLEHVLKDRLPAAFTAFVDSVKAINADAKNKLAAFDPKPPADLAKSFDELRDRADALLKKTKEQNEAHKRTAAALAALTTTTDANAEATKKNAAAQKFLNDMRDEGLKHFNDLLDAEAQQHDRTQAIIDDLKFEGREIGLNANERERAILLRKLEAELIDKTTGKLVAGGQAIIDEALAQLSANQARQSWIDQQKIIVDRAKSDAEDFRKPWTQALQSVAQGFGDFAANGFKNFKGFLDSMKQALQRWVADIISTLAQRALTSAFGNLFGGIAGGASGGGGFGSIFSGLGSLFGGGSATGGSGLAGSIGSWLGIGGAGLAGGTAGFGVLSGAGVAGGYGAGATGITGLLGGASGSTGGVQGLLGYGGGTQTATAAGSAASSSLAIPIIGAIIYGFMKNLELYAQGWKPEGGRLNFGVGGSVYGGGIGVGALGGLNAPSALLDRALLKLGIGGKWAAAFSGEAITTKLFGRQAPKIQSSGFNLGLGANGISGDQFFNIKEKGGIFSSSKKYTRTTALSEELKAQIQAIFDALQTAIAGAAKALAVKAPDIIAGQFTVKLDKKGNVTDQYSTFNGQQYHEDQAAFQSRALAENLLKTISVSAGDVGAIADKWRANADKLLAGAQFLLAAQIDITKGVGLLGASGGLPDVAKLIEELNKAGEPLLQTYTRLQAETALLDEALKLSSITLDKTREEVVRFADGIAEAAGGLDQAQALWGRYFDVFFTAEERAQLALQEATTARDTALAAINVDQGTTVAQFRALFEQALPNLSADAVVEWLRAADAIANVIDAEDALNNTRAQEAAQAAQNAADLASLLDQLQWNDYLGGLDDFHRSLAVLGRQFDDLIARATALGASEDQLAIIRGIQERQTQALIDAEARRVQAEIDAANAAQDAAWQRAEDELQNRLRQQFDALQQAAQQVQNFLNQQLIGPTSSLNPQQQLAAARQQFDDLARRAAGGDVDAISQLAQAAQTLLQLQGQFSGVGSTAFSQVEAYVRSILGPVAGIVGANSLPDALFELNSILRLLADRLGPPAGTGGAAAGLTGIDGSNQQVVAHLQMLIEAVRSGSDDTSRALEKSVAKIAYGNRV